MSKKNSQTKTTPATEPRWTIAELQERAAQALAVDYDGPANGRIRELPNERTLRYYTTIGLLDRPLEMRGRTAYYGWRQLLQIVAIKRLQAQGLSLVDVQQRLTGRPDTAIAAIAQLPEVATPSVVEPQPKQENEPDTTTTPAAGPGRRQRPFWRQAERPAPSVNVPAGSLRSLSLSAQLLLAWTGREGNEEDQTALRRAAQPLLQEMARRGLLGESAPDEGDAS